MSKPIQISEAATIGIHALVLISNSENNFMNVNVIAERTGSSKNHIAKVMQNLVKADFVTSVRGPAGGFSLSKDPNEITLLDVFESIEGKISMRACPFEKAICPFEKCLMGGVFHKLTDELVDYLKSNTLADMKTHEKKS
ncbi:MAG: Rrf2 family transcriptional regulator [Bacteroidetes bacterium HGW-Bacteroidetes-6]|jgi:Rrf2 family protein|nr:MAG: Rrf2 family transcriptional regulator [Bacteroidetes bacterium HGW-Bacteroidetes-6]